MSLLENCRKVFQTVYAQTKICPVITQHHLSDSVDDICKTAGQPVLQTEISIRSVDENHILQTGEIGEICTRGPRVKTKYNDKPAAASEVIDTEGWLHTGDFGTVKARGFFPVTSRVKEMIIRDGEKHFPAETKNCLLEHSYLGEIAVDALPDPKWGEVIGAFIAALGF